MDLLNSHVLIWLATEKQIDVASTAAFRKRLPFYKLNNEYFTGETVSGAFSFYSVLSIEYLLSAMVPALANIVNKLTISKKSTCQTSRFYCVFQFKPLNFVRRYCH